MAAVEVGGTSFLVEVADTPSARQQGLSGRESLGAECGMWFVFAQPQVATFWMKEMQFPLDIVWVTDELQIAGVAADVPAPGTPNSALPRYSSGIPVRYVLEINAGMAAELGIEPGDAVVVADS